MTVLICGSTGRLGQACMQNIVNAQAFDASDIKRLIEVLSPIKNIQAIINCAAYTFVDDAELFQTKCYAVNVTLVNRLVNLANHFDVPLLHFSTDFVFGQLPEDACDRKIVLREGYNIHHLPMSRCYYAHTKHVSEMLVMKYNKGIVARTCGLYSFYKEDFLSRFLDRSERTIKAGEEHTDLLVLRTGYSNPTAAVDVAKAAQQILTKNLTGLLHVVNPEPCSWFDFLRQALILTDQESKIRRIQLCRPEELGMKTSRPLYSALNTDGLASHGITLPCWRWSLAEHLKNWNEETECSFETLPSTNSSEEKVAAEK